ncbi:HAD family hydrolase [Anaerococcus sp. AGMB00486]|uniref:HAD family hydrolase n=1 Tax=Anaerococcus faecalis TaxID=2742993 RepID=A0ABX2NBT9_9FIRM|nr:HAD family hydrolase [Anaerococcus faecalis]NVF12187.1 HAD family hydrolase [Anaerococcus faecalis]
MYIFDIDGTLLYTIDSIAYNINESLKDFGLEGLPKEKIREFVGNGPVVLINKSLDYINFENNVEKRLEILNHYNKKYDSNPSYLTKPYDGIVDQLNKLKESGEIIVAFSNKPDSTCKKVIEEIFGRGYFDYVLGYREDIKRKPSPEGMFIIKERFGVDFTDIIYFGDSEVDIECGKNAGVFTVGCSWGFRDKDFLLSYNPDLLIDSPTEISKVRRV